MSEITTKIDQNWILQEGISYESYCLKMKELVEAQTTSGDDKSLERIEFTKLNLHRMKRINEDLPLLTKYSLGFPISAAIITEAWCGDSAQNIPWLEHFVNACSPKIPTYYFFRDEHPGFMNQFLTNGSRSIPICIFFNPINGNVYGTWGPRPEEIKSWLSDFRKQNPELTKHVWEIELHKYYTKNKGQAITRDLKNLISSWS
ncbi:MAG: thioredoxin family protein [Bacteroidota bacterium]